MIKEKRESEITVVACYPGKTATIIRIQNTLEAKQAFVGGYIQAVYPFDDPVAIVCNEEGKLNSMPLNRAVYAEPEEIDMSYSELRSQFYKAEEEGKHISGYVVFSRGVVEHHGVHLTGIHGRDSECAVGVALGFANILGHIHIAR